jgi:hypothetical protein
MLGVSQFAAIRMMEALETNDQLEYWRVQSDGWSMAGARAIGRMIRANRTIKILDLGSDLDGNEDATVAILSALTASRSIKRFTMGTPYRWDCHTSAREATISMLRQNTFLKELTLGWGREDEDPSYEFRKDVRFYLALSNAGRGKLGATPSKTRLVQTLKAVDNDMSGLSCIFYVLSNYPTLFHLTDPTVRTAANFLVGKAPKRRRLYRATKYNAVTYV